MQVSKEVRPRTLKTSPGLAVPKRPVLAVNKDQADENIFLAHVEPAVQVIGQLPEEGDLLRLGVSDSTGYLDNDDVRRPLDAQEVWIPNEVIGCVFAYDHEAITFWCFQDLDKPGVNHVNHSGPKIGRFSLRQVNACERHAPAVEGLIFARIAVDDLFLCLLMSAG